MSNSQYSQYSQDSQYETYESPGPNPGYPPPEYGGYDVHSAQTLAYGMPGAHEDTYRPAYEEDTYRPAYESAPQAAMPGPAETPGPVLPRQVGTATGALSPASARPARPARPAAPAVRAEATEGGRRAARRRRPWYMERSDSTVRRLLPQALVVAFLAGGTTAFVAKDKAVELTVDGTPRTLHTFADDVTELLSQESVEVGAHDVVAPARGTPLASGDEVAVHYGRPVRLTIDGHRREVWTTAHTVQEALEQLGVRAQGAYMSVSRSQPIGRAGLALDVRTERSVTIMADGHARTLRTNAATVREAVREAGVALHGADTTSVPADSFPRDGQTVTVLRIRGSKEVREEAIPFKVERTDDPLLFKGTEVVERAGQPGLRRVTYSLRTVNGVQQKPRATDSEVVREPQSEVVRVGTKPLPTSVHGADDLNWKGLAACESGGRSHAVDPSGTYGGLYQLDSRTWRSVGGSGRPQDAPAAEQTLRAKKLYVRRGASPWPHCGVRLRG